MFLLQQILPAVIVAMLVAAGISGLVLFWAKERGRIALTPVAIGVGYFVGHLFSAGWVGFPPKDTTNWLPFVALGSAMLSGCVVLATSFALWLRRLMLAFLILGGLRLLLNPKFQFAWSVSEGWTWVAGLLILTLGIAYVLDVLAQRQVIAGETLVLFLLICGGTFAALMISGSIFLAQCAAVLGAAVAGSGVLFARNIVAARSTMHLFSLLLVSLLVSGYFFADLPVLSASLIMAAPLFGLIPIRMSPLPSAGIRIILAALPVAFALFVAFRASPPLSD